MFINIAGQVNTMYFLSIIMLVMIISLAKRTPRRRRRRRAYIKGNVENQLALSTLAASTLLSGTFADAVEEKAFVSSIVATWALDNVTFAAGQGPVIVGIAHSDYTDSEIEQTLEQDTSWAQGDLISKEIAQRKVRRVGVFRSRTTDLQIAVLNDGRPIRTKLKWVLTTGQTLKFWAYNQGTNALSVSSPQLHIFGYVNIWPM